MARRITTGVQGKNVLGSLSTTQNSIVSVVEDDDIILDPSGQGEVLVEANVFIQDQKLLKLGDADASNYVAFRAPSALSSNYTLTFPSSAGTANYVLTTDGSGGLSWTNVAVQVGDDISADTATYNLLLTTATSGGIVAVKVVSSKLKFKPDVGQLQLLETTAASSTSTGALVVSGGAGIAGTVHAGNFTTTGTVTAGTITETSSIAYKENVNPIDGSSALNAILSLVGVTYDRKDGSTKNEAGLIAEDTAKILPNLVTYKNGKPDGINYTKLSAYLIEAVKTLKTEIDELRGNK